MIWIAMPLLLEVADLSAMRAAEHRYFACVDRAARRMAPEPGLAEKVADRAIRECATLRSIAIAKSVVPTAFKTIDKYDSQHHAIAVSTVNDARRVNF